MSEINQPILHGARVALRMLASTDVPDLFAMHSNAQVMRYWSCPAYTSMTQAQQLFEKNDAGVRAGQWFYWAITLADANRLIGQCTLFSISTAHRRAEIGYALARDHWGHGYAQEALRLVLAHAFSDLGLHRIEADVDPRNSGSMHLLERLGFVREGLLRERWQVNGEITDTAMFGLLAPDYAAATNAAALSNASMRTSSRTA